MKHLKLKQLEKSLEDGVISKEEYKKKKKEIEEMPEEKTEEKDEKVEDAKLKSDRTLIVIAIIIILVFAAIFGSRYFTQEQPKTIDELHEWNLK
jgi:cytochrome c-type biogenesis protein CcmH/NrfG